MRHWFPILSETFNELKWRRDWGREKETRKKTDKASQKIPWESKSFRKTRRCLAEEQVLDVMIPTLVPEPKPAGVRQQGAKLDRICPQVIPRASTHLAKLKNEKSKSNMTL